MLVRIFRSLARLASCFSSQITTKSSLISSSTERECLNDREKMPQPCQCLSVSICKCLLPIWPNVSSFLPFQRSHSSGPTMRGGGLLQVPCQSLGLLFCYIISAEFTLLCSSGRTAALPFASCRQLRVESRKRFGQTDLENKFPADCLSLVICYFA